MTTLEAILVIVAGEDGDLRVTATDQPEGSLVWALFQFDPPDDLPEWNTAEDDELPEPEKPAIQEEPNPTPPCPVRNGIWPAFGYDDGEY